MARNFGGLRLRLESAHPKQLASPDRSAIRHNSGKIRSTHPYTAAVDRSEFGSRFLKAPLAPSARPERISDKRVPDPPARLLIRRLDNYGRCRSSARTMRAPGRSE